MSGCRSITKGGRYGSLPATTYASPHGYAKTLRWVSTTYSYVVPIGHDLATSLGRLLRARAIENQSYLIATNRTGTPHPKLQYPGYSFILDSEGDSLAESKEPVERLLTAQLSKELLSERRQSFPVLQDLDPSISYNKHPIQHHIIWC